MRLLRRSQIDPAPVRARRRRRLHRRMIYAGACALVLGIASAASWYVERSGLVRAALAGIGDRLATEGARLHLAVQSVEVEGRSRADRQALLDALHVRRGTSILAVDLDAAKARLESVPWVRSAAVERQLPDTLYVRLVEQQPLALWQHHRKFDLIDENGTIIANAHVEDFPDLLQVVGDGAPAATADLLDLLGSEPALRRHVTAAVRIGDRRWNIELDDRIEVALPEEAAEAAWHRLAALDRNDRLLERDIKAVDMRLPDRLVLRVSPETAKSLNKKTHSMSPNT